MIKDYSEWHDKKSELNNNEEKRPFFHEREVWWCSLGANIGFEQDGKGDKFARPVLVLKKFNNEVFWALPVTTRTKKGKFYSSINLGDGVERLVILSQLRLIDAKRLLDKMATIDELNYSDIQKAVTSLLNS